jgi:hypothetical protein
VISALSGGLITVALSAVLALALPGFARYRAGQGGRPGQPEPALAADGNDDAGELSEQVQT